MSSSELSLMPGLHASVPLLLCCCLPPNKSRPRRPLPLPPRPLPLPLAGFVSRQSAP